MVRNAKKIIGVTVVILISVAAIVVISMLRINIASPETENFEEDLGETNFGEWNANSDVPPDPNNPGSPVQWHIRRSSNIAYDSNRSAEVFFDGRQDEARIWL